MGKAKGVHDVVILGSGPAGLTAAIYTARADLAPVLVEGADAGGQLMITTEVENYPGFEEVIMGPELMDVMKKQAARFGTKFIGGDATRVDLRKRPFTIETSAGTLEARALIIATGAQAKWLGLPNEQRLRGHGVSACATCDGFFFRNKVVYVVGGGDSAMEEATFLTKFASKVYVVHRRRELRASKIMQQRALSNPKLEIVWNSVVTDVLGDEQVTGLRLKDVKANEERDVQADGLFLAVGHKPNTDLFVGQLDLDEVGYVKLVGGKWGQAPVFPQTRVRSARPQGRKTVASPHFPPGTRTSVEGVFAAGDVADHTYRQAVTAAGMGCQAALDAERWLESQE